MWSFAVAEFTSREMHVVKRALAIAALAVERVTERSHSDDANLKELLIKLGFKRNRPAGTLKLVNGNLFVFHDIPRRDTRQEADGAEGMRAKNP